MQPTRPKATARRLLTTSAILLSLTAFTACAGQAPAESADAEDTSGTQEAFAAFEGENFDLDELIEKAQDEGPITIYDNASAVEDIAANFSENTALTPPAPKSMLPKPKKWSPVRPSRATSSGMSSRCRTCPR